MGRRGGGMGAHAHARVSQAAETVMAYIVMAHARVSQAAETHGAATYNVQTCARYSISQNIRTYWLLSHISHVSYYVSYVIC